MAPAIVAATDEIRNVRFLTWPSSLRQDPLELLVGHQLQDALGRGHRRVLRLRPVANAFGESPGSR
jgi:hypothetical protein